MKSASLSVAIVRELAPTGRLRVAINLGNSVLAQSDPATGAPGGVTVDLARRLGENLGVPVDLSTFKSAGTAFDALKSGAIDIVFLAIDPLRAEYVAFTEPYVLIEGIFLVAVESGLHDIGNIDRPGVRVAVARGSAYDLFLTRELKAATLVRMPTGEGALQTFVDDKLEVAGGVRQPSLKFMASHANLRMIEPPFMQIRQAMGTAQGRPAAAAYLRVFIEEAKASGFVMEALLRSGQNDVAVAPLSAA